MIFETYGSLQNDPKLKSAKKSIVGTNGMLHRLRKSINFPGKRRIEQRENPEEKITNNPTREEAGMTFFDLLNNQPGYSFLCFVVIVWGICTIIEVIKD